MFGKNVTLKVIWFCLLFKVMFTNILFLVDNWVRELKLWSPSLKVLVYYGESLHSSFHINMVPN